MKRRMIFRMGVAVLAALAGLAVPVRAQTNEMPFPDALAKALQARASNYTEVTLDRKMLDFAGNFMNDKDDAEGKRIIAHLKGIYVRTYEFDKPGQYTDADLAQIRRAFSGPDWSPIVKSRGKDEADDVYMKMVNGQMMGMIVLNAEPKELDFVYIDGPIRPQDLQAISGHFGVPSGLPAAGTVAPHSSPNPLYKPKNGGNQ
jgi:Domain of unknown function (DUF4252)